MLSWPLILSITPLQLIGTSRRVDTFRYVATHREPGMNMGGELSNHRFNPTPSCVFQDVHRRLHVLARIWF